MLAQLKLDEGAKLEFSVAISGTSEPPQYRFVIKLEQFDIVLRCIESGDQVAVDIPPLKNFTTAGDKEVHLEVVIDGKIFTPMKDVINFEPCIEIESKAKPVIKPEEMVKVANVAVTKVTPTHVHEETDDGYVRVTKSKK